MLENLWKTIRDEVNHLKDVLFCGVVLKFRREDVMVECKGATGRQPIYLYDKGSPGGAAFSTSDIPHHGLINYIDTKAKCRHLKYLSVKGLCGRCLPEFIDWRYRQYCWYFRPSFVQCCPSSFLHVGSRLPPPPPTFPINKYSVYTYTVCKGRGIGGGGRF